MRNAGDTPVCWLGALCAAAVAALIGASPAGAGTVQESVDGFVFADNVGEANDIEVFYEPDLRPAQPWRLVDIAAITPGAGCAQGGGPTEAICGLGANPGSGSHHGHLTLGAEDDAVSYESPTAPATGPDALVLVVIADAGGDDLTLSPGPDSAQLGAGDDTAAGGAGNDSLQDDEGTTASTLAGGAGNDGLVAPSTGSSVVEGGPGDDQIAELATGGDTGIDVFTGGEGTDGVTARAVGGVQTLDGGEGNDLVDMIDPAGPPQAGSYTMLGGPGNDTLRGSGVLGGGVAEALIGGDGNDVLSGQAGADTLTGGAGDDLLQPGAGNDTSDGGDGSDEFFLDADADTSTGGAGDDRFIRGPATGPQTIDGGPGNDLINGGDGNDSLAGGEGNDDISAGAGVDSLQGDGGDDLLQAADMTFADTVGCGDGADQVGPDEHDTIAADCEVVASPVLFCAQKAVSCSGTVEITAPASANGRPLAARAKDAAKPKSLGRSRFKLGRGSSGEVGVSISAKGRKLILRAGKLKTKMTAKVKTKLRGGKVKVSVVRTARLFAAG